MADAYDSYAYRLRICPFGQPTSDYMVGTSRDSLPIPRVGEEVKGPDDFGSFYVHDVIYTFTRGFYFPPEVFVIARHNRPGGT